MRTFIRVNEALHDKSIADIADGVRAQAQPGRLYRRALLQR